MFSWKISWLAYWYTLSHRDKQIENQFAPIRNLAWSLYVPSDPTDDRLCYVYKIVEDEAHFLELWTIHEF